MSRNRYREILQRAFALSISTRGVRISGGRNPVADVERYKNQTPEIRYLILGEVDEQLGALRFKPQLQTMVAA